MAKSSLPPSPADTERLALALGPGSDNGLTAQQHTELMRKAGFEAVGCVWQYGHSCVLVAVRT